MEHLANTLPNNKQNTLAEPDLAEILGVEDGKFNVQRTDGTVEKGWLLSSMQFENVGENNDLVKMVTVRRYDQSTGNTLFKTVPVAELKSWQADPEFNKYDRLFMADTAEQIGNIAVPSLVESSIREYEAALEEHNRKLFAPVIVEQEAEVEERKYDELFDPNYVAPLKRREFVQQGREYLTDENIERANEELAKVMQVDPTVRNLIQLEIYREKLQPEDLASFIRTNAEVRYRLGIHFLKKIEKHIDFMPERVVENWKKESKYGGYGEMTSKEYAALLALSLIDGSFDYKMEEKTFEYDKRGIATIAQHRYAARYLLEH